MNDSKLKRLEEMSRDRIVLAQRQKELLITWATEKNGEISATFSDGSREEITEDELAAWLEDPRVFCLSFEHFKGTDRAESEMFFVPRNK